VAIIGVNLLVVHACAGGCVDFLLRKTRALLVDNQLGPLLLHLHLGRVISRAAHRPIHVLRTVLPTPRFRVRLTAAAAVVYAPGRLLHALGISVFTCSLRHGYLLLIQYEMLLRRGHHL